MPRRHRLLPLGSSLLLGLLLLWLSLPRLAGFAVQNWLDVPGVNGLAVQFEKIGLQQVQIASLQFRYRTEAGDEIDV